MQQEYTNDQKISFMLPGKMGKQHWFPGVIHGVRRYEDSSGIITKITYLVDTGRDEMVLESVRDKRGQEIDKRLHKAMSKIDRKDPERGEKHMKLLQEISEHPDLPETELYTEKIRQPEQIELTAEFIRPRK